MAVQSPESNSFRTFVQGECVVLVFKKNASLRRNLSCQIYFCLDKIFQIIVFRGKVEPVGFVAGLFYPVAGCAQSGIDKVYSGVGNGTAADSNSQQRCGHRSEAAPELCGIIFHIPIPPFVFV